VCAADRFAESRGEVRARQAGAAHCHFGAGAVSEGQPSPGRPTLPGRQGAHTRMRNLGGTAVCRVYSRPMEVSVGRLFCPTAVILEVHA